MMDDDALLSPLGGISQKMQICTAITKHHTFGNILKIKNCGTIKSVFIHMYLWSVNARNIKPTFQYLLHSHKYAN